ncbi:efflux RND transporter permease subunit [Leeia sp. TBRC 13508]|uniref:Efflux RND transporter permease subunit n=1 Tax=Leeia speluncae TaxID=2884804 RepID=A0ABS8D6M1_9NEIS|nr:efflux RND transporter permease subunit [Leeia speluncae]MCB6183840.1 efflux RND transporter permease subunit [Leeia speluncae]
MSEETKPMGISGRIVALFQQNSLTPLLALIAILVGLFAVFMTPREEEPQINVTMANVMVPYPGARVADVEKFVATPYEQVLDRIAGVDHVYSVSRPGMAIFTVQFKVGVPHSEALVRLYDTIHAHTDALPTSMGVGTPIIKPKGIDDVPVMAFTFWSKDESLTGYDLAKVARTISPILKRVEGVSDLKLIGDPGRAINVWVNPTRLADSGVSISSVANALGQANTGIDAGALVDHNQRVALHAGEYFTSVEDVQNVVVGTNAGRPIYLRDVADITDGAPTPTQYVWYGTAGKDSASHPAITLQLTKKAGENAVDVANHLSERVNQLKGVLIPANVEMTVTRNYGETANDKAQKLIQKLLFATASVVALVWLVLGRREAAIVGLAVVLTLLATLFASWAWGFTLNRVSLFALIFSIGILVDDAIVVVENIHRHHAANPGKSLYQLIPAAVDEVGGPTILATLTVIAALLPMAFVSGLMGPYMSPIPINASMGMLISLAIAFVVTPWLAGRWLKNSHANEQYADPAHQGIGVFFRKVFTPFVDSQRGRRARSLLWGGILLLMVISVGLAGVRLVVLKMLPFDNKSEFQIVVDMPVGTPVEKTAAVLERMGQYVATIPEVVNYQAYAGTSAPINFNGLVRQYDLRAAAELGDIQVNLLDKHHRDRQSHEIASSVRPTLDRIAKEMGGKVNVVEVPPGPPVRAPIVAEIYAPDTPLREEAANRALLAFQKNSDLVAIDSTQIAKADEVTLVIDHDQLARKGITVTAVQQALYAAGIGLDATWLHAKDSFAPIPIRVALPPALQTRIEDTLQLRVSNQAGQLFPLSELVSVKKTQVEQPIYHKDLLPVIFVTADAAGHLDSPLYSMFAARKDLFAKPLSNGEQIQEYFIHPPVSDQTGAGVKWDGEWQITYETFRDMGAAYAVGLVLIYILVVAQFRSYLMPLIIMAPIPLTIIGVMPGHALLGAQFTATSMIGMIALAGIIVRNSILLVDFIQLQTNAGMPLAEAVIQSAATRAKPIVLTGLAAMLGAFFILDDPIFNGLAISLIFGILVSTLLTLVVIPILYFVSHQTREEERGSK